MSKPSDIPRKEIRNLRAIISDLLALPVAVEQLRYLDKGMGTSTRNAAWLRARAAISSTPN